MASMEGKSAAVDSILDDQSCFNGSDEENQADKEGQSKAAKAAAAAAAAALQEAQTSSLALTTNTATGDSHQSMVQLSRLLIRAETISSRGDSARDDNVYDDRAYSRKIPLSNNSNFVDDAADEDSNCSAFDVEGDGNRSIRSSPRRDGRGLGDYIDFHPGFRPELGSEHNQEYVGSRNDHQRNPSLLLIEEEEKHAAGDEMGGDIPIGIADLEFRIKDSCELAAEYVDDSVEGNRMHHGDQIGDRKMQRARKTSGPRHRQKKKWECTECHRAEEGRCSLRIGWLSIRAGCQRQLCKSHLTGKYLPWYGSKEGRPASCPACYRKLFWICFAYKVVPAMILVAFLIYLTRGVWADVFRNF